MRAGTGSCTQQTFMSRASAECVVIVSLFFRLSEVVMPFIR